MRSQMSEMSQAAESKQGSIRDQAREVDNVVRQLIMVGWQSAKDLLVDSGPQWAAAVAYYALLSTFPLLLVVGSIAAYFVDPNWAVERLTSFLGEFVPQGEGRVEEIVQGTINARGRIGLISFVALLWSGTRVFDALIRAMNIAYDVDNSYSFLKRILVEIGMLATIGVVLVLALTSGLLIRLTWNALEFIPADRDVMFRTVQGAVRGAFLLGAFFLVYRFVPRGRQHSPSALVGASVASLMFLLARPLFLFYVERFGNYNLIYGSLATAIVLLIWIWVAIMITLYGGEVAAHTHSMLVEGKSAEEVGRRHAERSGTRSGRQ